MVEVNNYYFEFSDLVLLGPNQFRVSKSAPPAKYCTYRGQNLDRVRRYVWDAERIWVETDTGVYYAKYKTASPQSAKVDEKEFMWIKLSAQDLK